MPVRCAALAVLALAGPDLRGVAEAAAPRVVVNAVGRSGATGTLLALDAAAIEVQEAGQPGVRIAVSELTSIAFAPGPPPVDGAGRAWLLFPNGDRVSAQLLSQEDEVLRCRWRSYPEWAPLRVPLEAVAGLLLQPVTSPAAELRVLRGLASAARNADVLLLANRDVLSGELLTLTAERCELQTAVGPVAVETSAVRGVAFNPELVQLPQPTGQTALVRLSDGSWLSLMEVRLESDAALRGLTLFGDEVRLPLQDVRRMDFFGPRVVSLAALPPVSAELRPWLSPPRTLALRPNRNTLGGFLSLDGVEHPRGWGLTSTARVTFSLDGRFSAFQARIGIDDAARGGGHAVFAVELDQRRVYTSPPLSGQSDPVDVGPLETRGAVEMTLVVEYGESGDVLDYADWVDALLFRETPP